MTFGLFATLASAKDATVVDRKTFLDSATERLPNCGETTGIGNKSWITRKLGITAWISEVTPGAQFEMVQTYRIQREHSYFAEGQGRVVERRHNRLVLDGLEGESVVLRYHYFPQLESTPPITIESVYFADDPHPFIKLTQPPSRVELQVR